MAYIKNTTETMTKIFEERRNFNVPQYQRKFEWNDENFLSLLKELMIENSNCKSFMNKISSSENPVLHEMHADTDFMKSQMFLGNIVLHGGDIVDGQQRLTSLMLISKGIFNYIEKKKWKYGDKDFLIALKSYLTPSKAGRLVPFIRSKVVKQEGVNEAILGLNERKIGNLKSAKLLKQVGSIFAETKEKVTIDTLELMAFKILSIQFIVLEINTIEDAFDIFEKLNSKSTPLQPSDLIKNKVLSCAQKINKFDEYTESFNLIDTNLDNLDTTTFFRMVVMIKRAKEFEEENIKEIYTRKRTLYNDIFYKINDESVIDIFTDILELSNIYNDYFVSRKEINNGHLNLASRFINTKKSQILSTITLYLAELHSKKEIEYRTFIESILWLENFFLRMFTLENNPAKEVDKYIPEVIFKIRKLEVKNLENIRGIFVEYFVKELEIKDKTIYDKIKNKEFTNDKARHLILKLWDETTYDKDTGEYVKDTYEGVIETIKEYEVHLEHLLPQKPTNWIEVKKSKWSDYKITGSDAKVSKDDDIYKYIYNIGNLFIAKDKDNISAGNSLFSEKISKISKDKIFKSTTFVQINNAWDPKDITNRAGVISDIYKKNDLLSLD